MVKSAIDRDLVAQGFKRPNVDFGNISAGGINTKTSKSGRVRVFTTPERKALVEGLASSFRGTAGELGEIRGLVRPGFSEFRRAGLERLTTNRQRSVSTLRDSLARRRVLGSSFAQDVIGRQEAEFAQQEAEFASITTLQELEQFTQFTERLGELNRAAFETNLGELNLQAEIALGLAGPAAAALNSANLLQAQIAREEFSQNKEIAAQFAAFGAGACSREFKQDFKPVTVLDKLDQLDITTWVYKPEMGLGDRRHISPMAEDFKRLFGVGDGVTLDYMDMLSVNLAAIKELRAEMKNG